MALIPVTLPTAEPISLQIAKEHLNVDHDDDNPLIARLIVAVRERAEKATRRQLYKATYDYVCSGCGTAFDLPLPPLRSVTSLKYYDTAGTLTTWAVSNYTVLNANARSARGRIVAAPDISWPDVQARPDAVAIRFVAGYVDPATAVATEVVPELLVTAMLLDLGMLYEQRQHVITGTIVAELPYGVREIYRSFKSYPGAL